MITFPRVGTDLSAQLARAGWASRYPGSAYLFSWYGGIYPASYSLLAPYLLGLTGTRQAMAVAAVVSAGLLALLLARHRAPRPRAAAPWVAVAMCARVWAASLSLTAAGREAGSGCRPLRAWRWPALRSARSPDCSSVSLRPHSW